jgi:hypothetical protein
LGEVEIVGRVERRRRWSVEDKLALLAEIQAEDARVTPCSTRAAAE